ncbi:MAG: beta-lactamase superfamily metal-dependent hydrolase [Planctomycetota bacterium]|nr:MAG: beta-lactamase superfamily metal-dependent hydrolase [Planctomycetota bacterium]
MKVHIVPSSVGESSRHQILATYIINDRVAIDAGVLGLLSPLEAQRRVQHVFLSHSHLDHLATLPIFIDNVYTNGPGCPAIWGSPQVLETLQQDIFNDRLWPDMIRLSAEESPFLRLETLAAEQPVEVLGLRITPVELKHVVPAFGFLVEELATGVSVMFVSDTGPTERIWEVANQTSGLKGIFLEASFPNSMRWLADKAAHLTPELFRDELAKLQRLVPVHVIHVKLAYESQILDELRALKLPNLVISEPGATLEFA